MPSEETAETDEILSQSGKFRLSKCVLEMQKQKRNLFLCFHPYCSLPEEVLIKKL